MKAINIYDYMFYRVSKWYKNKKNIDRLSSENAHIIVSISQGFTITDIVGIVFLEGYSKTTRVEIMDKFFPYFILFIVLLIAFNFWRYRNKYEELHEKYKDESKIAYNINTVIIFLLFILPILFIPVFLNIFYYSN